MSKINKINVGGVSYDIEDTSKEALANKVTTIDSASTDTQYASAKAIYDLIGNSGIYSEIIDSNGQGNPFVFSEKKLGIYFLTTNVSSVFYYKKTSNDSVRTIYSEEIPMIFIYYKNIEQVEPLEKFFVCFRRQNFQGDGKILVAYGRLSGENITTNYGGSIYGMPFDFLLKNYTQNISGVKTFTSIPKQSNTTAPTQDTEFTNKKYVDDQDALKENLSNKVSTIDEQSTNIQYPGAKAVWDLISEKSQVNVIDNNVDNPIIIANLKKGIYYNKNSHLLIAYKADDTSLNTRTAYGVFYLVIEKEFAEAEINEDFGYAIGCVSQATSQAEDGLLNKRLITKLSNNTCLIGGKGKETTYSVKFLTSTKQLILGEKIFSSIPQQLGIVAPTKDTEFTNKKYVDDAIAAISGGASVNYFDARQAFLFEGKDVGIYYPTNTNRINFMYNFLSGDSGGAKNGTVISFVIVNKVTAENPDTTKTYAVGTFLDGAGALQQFVLTYNGTNYVMTYYNNYYGAYMLTNYAQTINGIKTFGSFPVTPSSAPTTDYQTANKKYVDDLVGNINTVLATLTTPSNGGGN